MEKGCERWKEKKRKRKTVKVKQNKIKNSYITDINIEVQNMVKAKKTKLETKKKKLDYSKVM